MENKYSNKISPKEGIKYNVIVQLNNEWEIIETTGTYSNHWEYDDQGNKRGGGKVIAWKIFEDDFKYEPINHQIKL